MPWIVEICIFGHSWTKIRFNKFSIVLLSITQPFFCADCLHDPGVKKLLKHKFAARSDYVTKCLKIDNLCLASGSCPFWNKHGMKKSTFYEHYTSIHSVSGKCVNCDFRVHFILYVFFCGKVTKPIWLLYSFTSIATYVLLSWMFRAVFEFFENEITFRQKKTSVCLGKRTCHQ